MESGGRDNIENLKEDRELKKNDFSLRVEKAKVVALNNDISKYAKQKDLGRAVECFETALSNNWANSHTYAAIINAYVRCGDIEEASRVYETLKSRPNGVRLDVISCTTLMKGYCSQGDLIHAKRILNDMLTATPKIIPNIRTINTFLRGCVLVGALKDAEEIFPQIQQEFKLTPDISSWEYLVILLSQGLLLDKVFPIIGRLRSEKSLAGGVAAMCVNVSRAAAIVCELKMCRKYLTLATQLLQDDEELQLEININSSNNNNTNNNITTTDNNNNNNNNNKSSQNLIEDKGKNNQKQTIGGKQAWRNDSEDARNQSLEVYKEHRRAELRQEIECISNFIGKSNISIENILPFFKRILLFTQFDESISVEEFNLPDCLIAALISTLGYVKVLNKKNENNQNENNQNEKTQFQIYRNIILQNNNSNNKQKKGKDKKKDRSKKNTSIHKIVVPISIKRDLTETREYFENCLNSDGKLKLNNLFGENRTTLPLKLEICSGFGEWAVKQAVADIETGNWLTLELRQDRVYQTFTRSIFEGASNLSILCGDAVDIIRKYFPDGVLSNVFVNYPEPPQQIGGNETQSKHLLTESFFTAIDRILTVDGMLTILTDNLWYGKLLLKIISTNSHLRHLTNVELNCLTQETLRGFTLYCGKPGVECGHLVETSSYFDRLWQRGRQPDRYFIVVKKSNQQGVLSLNLSLSRGKKHALERVHAGAPKKIKFDDSDNDDNNDKE